MTEKSETDRETSLALIAFGSNLGDPERNVRNGLKYLEKTPNVRIVEESSFYKTFPVGFDHEQPPFVNGVVLIETSLSPEVLLNELHCVERKLLRKRVKYWGARTLDLDVVLYGDVVMKTEELTIPHPRLQWRDFVLNPACELLPDKVVPGLGVTFRNLRELFYWNFSSFSLFTYLLRRNVARNSVNVETAD